MNEFEAFEPEKRARRTARESEKGQFTPAERRAAMVAQFKRRFGRKQAP